MADAEDSQDSPDLSYREATEKIERTLRRIEGEQDVDIDELAEQVESTAELIQFCLGRLERAELRVQKVTEKLQQVTERSNSSNDSNGESSAGDS